MQIVRYCPMLCSDNSCRIHFSILHPILQISYNSSDRHQLSQTILTLTEAGGHHPKELACHHFKILVYCCMAYPPRQI